MRRGAVEVAEFAQFLGRHRDLVRPASRDDGDALDLIEIAREVGRVEIGRVGDGVEAARPAASRCAKSFTGP